MVERSPELPVPADAACDAAMLARYGQAAELMDGLVTAAAGSDEELMRQQIEWLEKLGLDVAIVL